MPILKSIILLLNSNNELYIILNVKMAVHLFL